MAVTLSGPDHMQAMPGITSQLQRGGNARLTYACLMSVSSVYLQILIIRTQIGLPTTHPLPCLHWNTSHGENITYQLKFLLLSTSLMLKVSHQLTPVLWSSYFV